jgi:protocatechuate 3,4-dioxygenase beta subunit
MITGVLLAGLLLQQPSSIEGVVVRAGTAHPIARAVVQLSGLQPSPLSMTTGADGRFEFRNIPPGSYRLSASRTGYLDSAYGPQGQAGTPAALSIAAAQTRKNIRLPMIASGAISGRIYDANGEPAVDIPVTALKYAYQDGQRTLTAFRQDHTDDRGEYRLFRLAPGTYYISATASAEVNWPSYYPGTAEVQAASTVELPAGGDIGAVDFTLKRVTPRKVRGTVVDDRGQPVASAAVALVPRTPSAAGPVSRPAVDGRFEIPNVLLGSYFLVATYWRNTGSAVSLMGGRVPLDVGDSDADAVSVPLYPAIDVVGEVIIESSNGNDAQVHRPSVSLKNELRLIPGRLVPLTAQFSTSRRFEISNVIEGDYRVQVSDLPKGAYVKAIRFAGGDVLNATLRIDPRINARLEIVLSMNAAVLDGTVLDENRKPVNNTPVALVPAAAHRNGLDLYRSAWTDEFGRFQFESIRPGDYRVFAREDVDANLLRDPDFAERHESTGPIRVTAGGRQNVEITVR